MSDYPAPKQIRIKLGLNQEEFSDRYGIPIKTLQDWEQDRSVPSQACQSYLSVIEKNPGVRP